ncbi:MULTISPECIES: type II 3-dehydroquinate dehydratase [unclassified Corallococcus]|uniref:type II 3-dehydroquinate dehydratase n=1 Tax=unclassified Corallococcus TaxID=2685029 RepID=UPI001CBFDC1B|nr:MULTISPECIES: type II 3-dehydroquinate dehydratase [unclassified Corallococcus]MBZ4332610.1 3-dehydroquinate dehydratase [Corallococcus sp. AS-1-12]MBZ4375274.1 3-dehydroquinate dehydratase [Corallococcus sp. AS-1-6]
MGMKLLVLHGPNLNLLGEREDVAGGRLTDLDAALRAKAKALGLTLTIVQSNHEGVLIDTIHAERKNVEGILINPAGYFTSYALKEALEAVGLPAIEVLLKPPARESVVAEACAMQVLGLHGFDPYIQALETFASGIFHPAIPGPVKTLGRRKKGADADDDSRPKPKLVGRVHPLKKDDAPEPTPLAAPARSLRRTAEAGGPLKTLGRKSVPTVVKADGKPGKTLGRAAKGGATPASDLLTRALVRQKIADRLAGRLSEAELATWARAKYQQVQRGEPAESGHRELLEDSLQSLTLSHLPATRMSDEQLVDLMTRLEEG